MSYAKIRSALMTGLVASGAFATNRIVPDNLPFATDGAVWCRFIFPGADSTVGSLGPGGVDNVSGFVQLDINCPMDKGDAPCLALADTLKTYFTAQRILTYDSVRLNVRDVSLSSGRIVDGHYRRSVTVYWFTQIARS